MLSNMLRYNTFICVLWLLSVYTCGAQISVWCLCCVDIIISCNTLQRTATHCTTLQPSATCTNTNLGPLLSIRVLSYLRHDSLIWVSKISSVYTYGAQISDPMSLLRRHYYLLQHTITHCNTLQHTAPHHNTLQHTAAHCNTLQHTASHCITLQHTATHYNTLQHTATHGNTLQSAQIQIRTLFYPHLFSHIRDMTHSYVCFVFHLCTHQVRRYQI